MKIDPNFSLLLRFEVDFKKKRIDPNFVVHSELGNERRLGRKKKKGGDYLLRTLLGLRTWMGLPSRDPELLGEVFEPETD